MKILSGLEYVLRKAQVSKVLLTLELLLLFMRVKSSGVHVHVASIDSYPLLVYVISVASHWSQVNVTKTFVFTQEWEAFASSHVSLGKQLQPLTQLILDWRKIELKYVVRKFLCNSKQLSESHAVKPESLVSVCSLHYLCYNVGNEVCSSASLCALM